MRNGGLERVGRRGRAQREWRSRRCARWRVWCDFRDEDGKESSCCVRVKGRRGRGDAIALAQYRLGDSFIRWTRVVVRWGGLE